MADGRCITSFDASRVMNDSLMAQNNIAFQDNFKYRTLLQAKGPDAFTLPLKNAACRTGRAVVLVEDE